MAVPRQFDHADDKDLMFVAERRRLQLRQLVGAVLHPGHRVDTAAKLQAPIDFAACASTSLAGTVWLPGAACKSMAAVH